MQARRSRAARRFLFNTRARAHEATELTCVNRDGDRPSTIVDVLLRHDLSGSDRFTLLHAENLIHGGYVRDKQSVTTFPFHLQLAHQ